VALALKQFFASCHLRIVTIPNLEPGATLPIRDVRPKAVFGYDPL